MSREITIGASELEGAHVGDEFLIEAKARVVAIAEDLVDVTPLQAEPESQFVAGERKVTLVCSRIRVLETLGAAHK